MSTTMWFSSYKEQLARSHSYLGMEKIQAFLCATALNRLGQQMRTLYIYPDASGLRFRQEGAVLLDTVNFLWRLLTQRKIVCYIPQRITD